MITNCMITELLGSHFLSVHSPPILPYQWSQTLKKAIFEVVANAKYCPSFFSQVGPFHAMLIISLTQSVNSKLYETQLRIQTAL